MTTSRLPREDLTAALAARRELGPDYDDAFIDSVVHRIEESLEARPPAPAAPAPRRSRPPAPAGGRDHSLLLAVLSLMAAIPLGAVGAVNAGFPGFIFACVTIILVNALYTHRPQR